MILALVSLGIVDQTAVLVVNGIVYIEVDSSIFNMIFIPQVHRMEPHLVVHWHNGLVNIHLTQIFMVVMKFGIKL